MSLLLRYLRYLPIVVPFVLRLLRKNSPSTQGPRRSRTGR